MAKGEAIPKSHEPLLANLRESFPNATGNYDEKSKTIHFSIGGNGPAKEVAKIRAVSCCAVNSRFEVQTTLAKLDAPKPDFVTVNADSTKEAKNPMREFLVVWTDIQYPWHHGQPMERYSPWSKQQGYAEVVLIAKN